MANNIQAKEVSEAVWEKAFKGWNGTRKGWTPPMNALNGLPFPVEYRDLTVITCSHRVDSNSLRVVLGNDIAVKAAREKNYNPWPEGTFFVKVIWNQRQLPTWPASWVPGDLWLIGTMRKDSKKFKDTLGWGFAMWEGNDLKPYGENADYVQECVDCHLPLKDQDYVFTVPAIMP